MHQLQCFGEPSFSAAVDTRAGRRSVSAVLSSDLDTISEVLQSFLSKHLAQREFKQIWIKPNITGGEPSHRGRTSSPEILEVLLNALSSILGANFPVFVADSSVIGCDTEKAARLCGILSVCEKHGIPFVDLRSLATNTIPVSAPLVLTEIAVARPFADRSTCKINLAKIKSTYGSAVAFCIKNAKVPGLHGTGSD